MPQPIRFVAMPCRAHISEIAVLIGDRRMTLDEWLAMPQPTPLHAAKRRPELIETALQDA